MAARNRWRYAPLAYAALTYAAAAVTFGAGAVLSLAGFPLSLLHLRHVPPPRGVAFWLGVALNGIFAAAVVYVLIALQIEGELF